jgi:hypothetical protein
VELVIAIVLFVAIVASWLFLPSSPAEKSTAYSAAPAKAVTKAGRTA